MKRREFITLVGGLTAAWPIATLAQQRPALPVIGFLNGQSAEDYTPFVAAFRQGLRQVGYVEGQNALIQYRWAHNQRARAPVLAAELVQLAVDVIVACAGDHMVRAAKSATTTIPIVATIGSDPVETGLVQSVNQPGGNLTGISVFAVQLVAKRLELARELVADGAMIAFLNNPNNPNSRIDTKDMETAARSLGQELLVVSAATETECEAAFAGVKQRGAGALIVQSDPFFNSITRHLVALATRHAVPVVYPRREFVTAGGLMSYGTSLTEAYRQVGIYTGRILRGDKPANLPILLPTRFETVVNLRTANDLGLTLPTPTLLRADEVIE